MQCVGVKKAPPRAGVKGESSKEDEVSFLIMSVALKTFQ